MGANGATKCLRVCNNVERILAIELMNGCQALSFRRPKKSSPAIEKIVSAYRELVPILEKDRFLAPDIEKSVHFLRTYPIV
jgi:histidine ammonia-lyase